MNKLSNLLSLTEWGFYDHLEEDGLFILIWTCNAVLAVSRDCHFSKLSPIQNKTHKNKNVVLFYCHVVLRNDAFVKLHGRSHPAPRLYEGDLLSGLWTLWVSGVEGYKGCCEVHGFKDLMNRRSQQFQGS